MVKGGGGFRLQRTDRIETGRGRRWATLLKAAVIGAVIAPGPAVHGGAAAPAARFRLSPVKVGHDTWRELDYDRPATALQKRIEDATVLIVVMNDHKVVECGSGTILADQRINGEKAIMTIAHVVGDRALNRKFGLSLAVFNHDGTFLGQARPVSDRLQKTPHGQIDQPVLIGFTPVHVNRAALARIQGVELAPQLVDGVFAGHIAGPIASGPGVSGGGWYNDKGQLVGVTDLTFKSRFSLDGDHKIIMAGHLPTGAPGAFKTPRIRHRIDHSVNVGVQGLGVPALIDVLDRTTVRGAAPVSAGTGASTIKDAVGFGYPYGVSMGWRVDRLQHDWLAQVEIDSRGWTAPGSVKNELARAVLLAARPSETVMAEKLTQDIVDMKSGASPKPAMTSNSTILADETEMLDHAMPGAAPHS